MTSIAATTQDFKFYAGDHVVQEFTVLDTAGNAVDISAADEITWTARRDLAGAAVLSKSKTGGGITVGGGTGKFQLLISNAESQMLTAFYIHAAVVTLPITSPATPVTAILGRMQVGRAPIWTYSGDPSLSDRDAVRFYISDTDAANPLFYDGEIDYLLTKFPTALFAAAQAARSLAGKFAAQVTSKKVGDLALTYADKAKNYLILAASLQSQAEQAGAQLYSGGTNKSDMAAVAADSNRVPQPFSRGQFDITPQSQGPAFPPDAGEDL